MKQFCRSLLGLIAWLAVAAASAAAAHDELLVDQFGHEVPPSSLNGHFLLVYFGYTSCSDICPTALSTMTRTLDLLGAVAHDLVPVFVTVDPERDTVAVMHDYIGHFHPRFLGLTGSARAVSAAQRSFAVTTKRAAGAPGSYSIDHGLFIYLAGADGKVLQTFHAGQSAEVLAAGVRKSIEAEDVTENRK